MSARIAEHLRSNVVAYLVLFVAVTVVPAYAAGLKRNSVKSKQIKDGQVKAVDADATQLQLRVGGSCQPSESIRAVNQDGTVVCEPDDQGGAPSGSAGGDLTSSYPNPTIAPNAVALTTDTTGSYVGSVGTTDGLTGGAAGSEGAALDLGLDYSATLAGNPTLAAGRAQFSANGVVFEGLTANSNETELTAADPTADRTVSLPDASGTVSVEGTPASFSTLNIGSGATITRHLSTVGVLDFPAIAGQSCADLGVTVAGAVVGNTVALGVAPAVMLPGLSFTGFVAGPNALSIRACNVTGTAQDPPAQGLRVDVWQH